MDVASEDPAGLQLLQYFLPNKNDALAYMGIMGLNPADSTQDQGSVEDQVEEPEVDRVQEIIIQEAKSFFEEFKAQKAHLQDPDSGKFQNSMRKRLSKAHATYLDQGRHDLTKHGGGFHLPRKKVNQMLSWQKKR